MTIAHALILQVKGQPHTLITWGTLKIAAFDQVRVCLTSEPVLAFPDFSKPFVIFTDASDYGFRAILSQLNENGKDRSLAYASRQLNKTEQNI